MIRITPNCQSNKNHKPKFSGKLILNTSDGLTSTLMKKIFYDTLTTFGERVRTKTSPSLEVTVSHMPEYRGKLIPIDFVINGGTGKKVCPYRHKWEDLKLAFVDKKLGINEECGFCLNPLEDAQKNAEQLWHRLQKIAGKCITNKN